MCSWSPLGKFRFISAPEAVFDGARHSLTDDDTQNAQHRSIFANCYLDDSIQPGGYIEWSATDPRVNFNTTMAEYHDYGPGFNLTGRLENANITKLLTPAQYAPYSTLEKVFQYPFSGKFGNTGWIDRSPAARR